MSDFLIGVKSIDEDTQVQISPLSITPESGDRGIADIDVIGGSAELYIFITDKEIGKKVKKYKDGKWSSDEVRQDDYTIESKFGKWAGHIRILLSEGDPPIAVG